MSQYGRALLWAALAFFLYGAIGQLFTRPSLVAPSHVINTALFLRTFGVPIQLLRGLSAAAIADLAGRFKSPILREALLAAPVLFVRTNQD